MGIIEDPLLKGNILSLIHILVSNALRLRWVKLHDAKKTQSEPYQDAAVADGMPRAQAYKFAAQSVYGLSLIHISSIYSIPT